MSEQTNPASSTGASSAPAAGSAGGAPASEPATGASTSTTPAASATGKGKDPLRGSRASGAWVFVVVLVLLLALLAIFVLQNTQDVEVSFMTWTGTAPLAATLLIATAAGLLIAVMAGSLRILQLRRRVKKESKQSKR
jgi:uncharacterized integral membrane protein